MSALSGWLPIAPPRLLPQASVILLRDAIAREDLSQRTRLLVERVCTEVAAEHGISMGELYSPSRVAHVVRARDHALAVLRWSTTLSLPALGRVFGGRDHTTVMVAIRRHEALLNGGA